MMLGLSRRRRGISAKLAEQPHVWVDITFFLPLGRKCLPVSNSKAFHQRGEGARACEKGTNANHRQKFNCVEEGSETLSEHLAASGGQLFLKEVFINFVVRLGNDREWEEVEKGTENRGRIQSPFKSNRDSICMCLSSSLQLCLHFSPHAS